jgi:hypothetical protein
MGSWTVEGTELILTDESGTTRFPFAFQDEQLSIYFETLNATITFDRM